MNNWNNQPEEKTVAVIVGTRPEAIKLAPVILELGASSVFSPLIVSTSQHRQMVTQILDNFGLSPDLDLDVMRPRQSLSELTGILSNQLGLLFQREKIDAVIVQGDTTSAFIGGLCAFYHKIPVAHVEAGLRSNDRYSPFPEELNRSMLTRLATWHFAPTDHARRQLLNENISAKDIYVCGNTVVDALNWMIVRLDGSLSPFPELVDGERLVLVTCHRRENIGKPMIDVATAVARLCRTHPKLKVLFPMHPNPAVRDAVIPILEHNPQVTLCEPLDYDAFLCTLKQSFFVMSDSGGIQEEATALGKPVLVLRRETERPEGVHAGTLRLVGTDASDVFREADNLLSSPRAYASMTRGSNIYGDGHAAEKIVRTLENDLAGASLPSSCTGAFQPCH